MSDCFSISDLILFLYYFCSEINQNSAVIEEEIEKCKGSAMERKTALDEEKEHCQKAAYAVLDMLNRN